MKTLKTKFLKIPFLNSPHYSSSTWDPYRAVNPSPSGKTQPSVQKYRTIWISDTHLGTKGCKAEFLLDFLHHNDCETLYLVGDIVDGWQIKRSWFWQQSHNDVIQKILNKAHNGTKVIYVPGNHDEAMREFTDMQFGGILVEKEWIHQTADGRRFLVIHGDEFDGVVKFAKWLAILGDWSYQWVLQLNTHLNKIRKWLGMPYWSLSAFLKYKVKNAVAFIDQFEVALANVAKQRNLDGVVCGHIHHPEIRDLGGVLYCNDGDWVESCSALVEQFNGHLEIVRWTEVRGKDHTEKIQPNQDKAVATVV